jgi:hypothetical protein
MANMFADCDSVEEIVFQAVGAASVCWEEAPTSVFDSTQAKQVAEDALAEIRRRAFLED